MKAIGFWSITLALSLFGVVTVFLSGSVILDLFNIRSHEGNYVLFVVWANLSSGLLFLAAAFGFIKKKVWQTIPLVVSAVILMLALLGLIIHISAGGLYENKTVGAMIFRIAISLILFATVHFTYRAHGVGDRIKKGLFIFIPILIGAWACNRASDKTDAHDQTHAKDNHEHHDNAAAPAIVLDNGEKWTADENTLRLVRKMEDEILAFGKTPESNYKILADSLRKDLDLLVAGCTMKGKAHDELHKWLLPTINYVKALSGAETKQEANEILMRLDESFDVFNQSFK